MLTWLSKIRALRHCLKFNHPTATAAPAVLGLLLAGTVPCAHGLTLAWDAVTNSATAGYRLYIGGASGSYTNMIDAGNHTNTTVSGLVSGGTYYFAVTDYTTDGLESDFSGEISYQVPASTNPPPPTVTLTSPGNGAVYTAPALVSFSANVTTNGHTINKVQFYNGPTVLGEDAVPPYIYAWSNVAAGAYTVSAQVVYDGTNSVAGASVSITVSAAPPAISGSLPATSGTISGFVVTNGIIYQTTDTGVTNGGRAAYSFTVSSTGDYLVSGQVCATNDSANSFYVNIDAEPTDPTMIWDIPLAPGFTNQTVSWRGNGSSTNSQFVPKVFNLAQGSHQLILRGREAYTQLASLSIVPATVLPAPWQAIDIGNPGLTGGASINGNQYTVTGAGSLSGSADGFRFLYQSMTSDGEIRARLDAVQSLASSGRAGVIMRESLAPGARYAFLGIGGNGTVYWQRRGSTSGSTSSSTAGSATLPGFWARLVRSGNKFYGYKSQDGTNWTRVASSTIGMATNIYFGFAVASGSTNSTATATYGNAVVVP